MKTKIIPFDLETARKIQAGEIKGKVLNNLKNEVRIVCFDREDALVPIIALFKIDGGEGVMYVRKDGHAVNFRYILVLEVPDNEPQFKPFDKVLCRDSNFNVWEANLFSHESQEIEYPYYVCGGNSYKQCIHYEGHEYLVGTTDKPKEY